MYCTVLFCTLYCTVLAVKLNTKVERSEAPESGDFAIDAGSADGGDPEKRLEIAAAAHVM